jgi:hypothetical protein
MTGTPMNLRSMRSSGSGFKFNQADIIRCRITYNVQRFLLGGAAHRSFRGASQLEVAPVSEKRVGLSRSPDHSGYGR